MVPSVYQQQKDEQPDNLSLHQADTEAESYRIKIVVISLVEGNNYCFNMKI